MTWPFLKFNMHQEECQDGAPNLILPPAADRALPATQEGVHGGGVHSLEELNVRFHGATKHADEKETINFVLPLYCGQRHIDGQQHRIQIPVICQPQ